MNEAHAPVTVYTGRTTNWAMLATVAVLTVLLIINASAPWTAAAIATGLFILLVLLFTLLTSTSLRVTAGSNGVSIRAGVFAWPRYNCPLDDIERVEPVQLSPLWWGAGVWWLPWGDIRFAWRSGPSIKVHRRNGRNVIVNVDDPEAVVATIEAARHEKAPGR